ncbi:Uncharacterized protein DAT39_020149 [Clarias magur]|uniref:Uncharacterized protein n=1 Tax=Clarias magur TaxID=1594786 RepID=A0A8J4TG21_CLAMG|nr:Uncharacterized protein DAT39_020149 [Clarias magur]
MLGNSTVTPINTDTLYKTTNPAKSTHKPAVMCMRNRQDKALGAGLDRDTRMR